MTDDLFIPRPKGHVGTEQPRYQIRDGHLRDLFDKLAGCDEEDEVRIEQLIHDHIYETCRRKDIPMSPSAPTFVQPPS